MGVFTGGMLEEAIVRRADLIIALGLDLVELIPRRWPYSAPVLSLRRTPSTHPALAAPGGGTYFTPALEVMGDLALILEELAPRLVRADARADWDVAEVDRLRRERASALEVPVPGLAPHRVVQLTHVARPKMFMQRGSGGGVKAGYIFAITLRISLNKVVRQQVNVFATLS